MRAHKSRAGSVAAAQSVRNRILTEIGSHQDEALVFAASSIITEINSPQHNGEVVVRTVRTDAGTYTLRGSSSGGPTDRPPITVVYTKNAKIAQPAPSKETRIHSRFRLSFKEERIARLLMARKTNDEIAAELCLSPHTVRHHVERIMIKLGVQSRRDVVKVLSRD